MRIAALTALFTCVALTATVSPHVPAPTPAVQAPAPDPCDEPDESDCDNTLRPPLDCTGEAWRYNGWCQFPGVITYLSV